jgi:hypothetical protein
VLADDTFDDVGDILTGISRFFKEFVDLFLLYDGNGGGAFLEVSVHVVAVCETCSSVYIPRMMKAHEHHTAFPT